LDSGREYQFQVVAENGAGKAEGSVSTFKVLPTGVLCNTAEAQCKEGNRYQAGTKTKASLKSGTSLVLSEIGPEAETLSSCKASTMEGEVTGAGGSGKAATANISSASFGECTWATSAEGLNWSAEINRAEGLGAGTERLSTFKVKLNIPFFGTCIYGGSPTFAVNGGSQAELSVAGAIFGKAERQQRHLPEQNRAERDLRGERSLAAVRELALGQAGFAGPRWRAARAAALSGDEP
jgi:hypothetical protein